MKKKLTLLVSVTAIFVVANYFRKSLFSFLSFITDNQFSIFVGVITCFLCCITIILIIVNVLNSDKVEKCYYHCFHVAFVFLPIATIGQYISLEKKWMIIVSFIISLFMAYCIYKKIQQANKMDIQYLKYSRLFLFAILTIFFSLVKLLCKEINFEIIHYLFFLSPLLMLQLVYEKIDLERKGKSCEPSKTEPAQTLDIAEEK
jgi:hypothetical protein